MLLHVNILYMRVNPHEHLCGGGQAYNIDTYSYMHKYRHISVHTYIYATYIHTYIHTYTFLHIKYVCYVFLISLLFSILLHVASLCLELRQLKGKDLS